MAIDLRSLGSQCCSTEVSHILARLFLFLAFLPRKILYTWAYRPSVLFHSLQIILDLERASTVAPSSNENRSGAVCLSSAQDIIAILRKYRSQHGLQYAPLAFIYGAVQAAQVVASFGIPEEWNYLLQVLDECSPAWTLARHAKGKLLSLCPSASLVQ